MFKELHKAVGVVACMLQGQSQTHTNTHTHKQGCSVTDGCVTHPCGSFSGPVRAASVGGDLGKDEAECGIGWGRQVIDCNLSNRAFITAQHF